MKGEIEDFDPDNFNDYTVYESDSRLKRKIGKP